MVVTCLPATAESGTVHARVGSPSTCTGQAPHSAMPQPYFVPVRASSSRRIQSSGVSGAASTFRGVPFTLSETIGDLRGRADRVPGGDLRSGVMLPSPRMDWKPEMDELRRREAFAEALGGPERVKRQHAGGGPTSRERVERCAS